MPPSHQRTVLSTGRKSARVTSRLPPTAKTSSVAALRPPWATSRATARTRWEPCCRVTLARSSTRETAALAARFDQAPGDHSDDINFLVEPEDGLRTTASLDGPAHRTAAHQLDAEELPHRKWPIDLKHGAGPNIFRTEQSSPTLASVRRPTSCRFGRSIEDCGQRLYVRRQREDRLARIPGPWPRLQFRARDRLGPSGLTHSYHRAVIRHRRRRDSLGCGDRPAGSDR